MFHPWPTLSQVRVRPTGEGQIYVPLVSIAYAEKRAENRQEGTSIPGSFAAEYSMDTWMMSGCLTAELLIFVVLLCFFGSNSCFD